MCGGGELFQVLEAASPGADPPVGARSGLWDASSFPLLGSLLALDSRAGGSSNGPPVEACPPLSACSSSPLFRRYLFHLSGSFSLIIYFIIFLHAGVWGDHPLLGPGLWTARSLHPGYPSEKPYLSKSLLLRCMDLLSPALEPLGVSIPTPSYGIPPSLISTCWASSPASNLHSFGVPCMDLIIWPSHCCPSGSLLKPHALITPLSVPMRAALVLRACPNHTPFCPSLL